MKANYEIKEYMCDSEIDLLRDEIDSKYLNLEYKDQKDSVYRIKGNTIIIQDNNLFFGLVCYKLNSDDTVSYKVPYIIPLSYFLEGQFIQVKE